jgi:hypothetical protein
MTRRNAEIAQKPQSFETRMDADARELLWKTRINANGDRHVAFGS